MFNLEFYDQYRAAERMLAGLMERNPDAAALFPQPGHDYISVAALYQVCCEFMIDPGVRAKIDRDKIERVTHRIRKQTTEDLSRSTMMYGLDFVAYPPNLFIHLKDRDNVYCSYNAWMVWSFQGLQIVKDQKPEIYEAAIDLGYAGFVNEMRGQRYPQFFSADELTGMGFERNPSISDLELERIGNRLHQHFLNHALRGKQGSHPPKGKLEP